VLAVPQSGARDKRQARFGAGCCATDAVGGWRFAAGVPVPGSGTSEADPQAAQGPGLPTLGGSWAFLVEVRQDVLAVHKWTL
jgi:hypothetical protein